MIWWRRLGGFGMGIEIAGVDGRGDEIGVVHQGAQKGDIGLAAEQHGGFERGARARNGLLAVLAPHNQLRDHRVEGSRDRTAFGDAAVPAHVLPLRRNQAQNRAGGRKIARGGIFSVDAQFDGVATGGDGRLLQRQRLAGGDGQLLGHQIDAGDLFRDRVLDLQPGVHLEEEEFPLAIDELHRSRAAIADSAGDAGGGFADMQALVGAQYRSGRFLHDLLEATLHRAFPLEDVYDLTMSIAKHLHFDVPRLVDEALHIEAAVAEIALSFAASRGDLGLEHAQVAHDAHALAATAGGGLDQQRCTHGARAFHEAVRIVVFDGGRGHGKAALLDEGAGAHLVTHQLDLLGLGADEGDARRLHRAREIGVLGQESVARMDGTGAAGLCCCDDLLGVEVGGHRRLARDFHSAVCLGDCRAVAVGGVIHHGGAQPERMHGADYPQRDFAAIGDQDGIEGPAGDGGHRRHANLRQIVSEARQGGRSRCPAARDP